MEITFRLKNIENVFLSFLFISFTVVQILTNSLILDRFFSISYIREFFFVKETISMKQSSRNKCIIENRETISKMFW